MFLKQLWSRCVVQTEPLPSCLTLQDENGVNRPVCSYVRVLRASRLLESPRQAARFVSLLAHEKAPVVGGGGGKQEQWCTLMSFLCRGKVSTTGMQRSTVDRESPSPLTTYMLLSIYVHTCINVYMYNYKSGQIALLA